MLEFQIRLCQIRKIPRSPTRQCPVHLRMGQTLVHTRRVEDDSDIGSPGIDGPSIMPEDPYDYIMAAYEVPPSPDYIPGHEVPPSPDYIPGPEEPQSPPPLDFVLEPMYPEYMPQEDEILSVEEQQLPAAAASPIADSPGYVPESDPEEEPEEDDEDEEEEEEHPALADYVLPVHRITARISIRDKPSISLPPREEVERLLALTTPPPSPLTPLSSPLPHIPSPPFPASPPLQLLSSDHRTDMPEITLPPRKRLGIDLGHRVEEVGYGIRDVWVDPREAVEEVTPMTFERVNARVTELTVVQEQDIQDIYVMIEDTQDRQTQIYQSVETLFDDKVSYMTRSEILALRSVVLGQQAVISQLQAADRKSQKMAPKRKTTRLNPGATPTPVTDTHTTTSVTNAQIQAMINEGVTAALAARDATRNGDDSHTSGTGARRPVQVARECTYPDFLKCQPLNFKGIEGVVKFATCTLQGNALTWWNSHVKTTTPEAAHAMPWRTLKKMMTNKYCLMGEIKKLEFEL
ncbi:hypothetical protein Tco_1284892 [Tanacetum coccineum]